MRGRHRAKRRRREEELEELPHAAAPHEEEAHAPPAAKPAPAARALDLQKTAGNRAVGAALDRWSLPWVPQAALPHWPKEPQVIFDGLVVPMENYQDAGGRTPQGTGTAAPRHEGSDGEFVVTIPLGEWSAELLHATATGKEFAKVELVIPGAGIRWILTGAVISGFQESGQVHSVSITFRKRELSKAPPSRGT